MEALGRVELPTNSLGNCCSIHLSYRAVLVLILQASKSQYQRLLGSMGNLRCDRIGANSDRDEIEVLDSRKISCFGQFFNGFQEGVAFLICHKASSRPKLRWMNAHNKIIGWIRVHRIHSEHIEVATRLAIFRTCLFRSISTICFDKSVENGQFAK